MQLVSCVTLEFHDPCFEPTFGKKNACYTGAFCLSPRCINSVASYVAEFSETPFDWRCINTKILRQLLECHHFRLHGPATQLQFLRPTSI